MGNPENWPINRITRAIRAGIEKTDKILSRKKKGEKSTEDLGNVDTNEAKEYEIRDRIHKNYDKDINKG